MLKVQQFSNELREIRPDLAVETISEKLESAQPSDALATALQASDRILDMTASPGASRTLCAIPERSRATSAFFNPAGTSVAVLQEGANAELDLATLEALYYAEIVHNISLHDHLRPGDEAVVSGGQCRSVTSRIPASRAAILSSIAPACWAIPCVRLIRPSFLQASVMTARCKCIDPNLRVTKHFLRRMAGKSAWRALSHEDCKSSGRKVCPTRQAVSSWVSSITLADASKWHWAWKRRQTVLERQHLLREVCWERLIALRMRAPGQCTN